jgi:hypothetical protein
MNLKLKNKALICIVFCIIFLIACNVANAESVTNKKIDLPDNKWINNKLIIFDKRFTASRLDDNNFEKGIYIFDLSARSGSWYLTLLSMNECNVNEGGINSFEPSRVAWVGSGEIEGTQVDDNKFTITVYQAKNKQLPANIILTFDKDRNVASIELTKFVDQNALPNQVIPVEYVPLQDEKYKNADCPVLLRGIE